MEAAQIEELRSFVENCKRNPSVLHSPSLAFFKNFLQSLGAQIPDFGESDKEDEDVVESDVELDNTDVVEADNDPPQKMGDPSVEVTEENQEAAQLLKAKAVDAIAEGKCNEAKDHLTEAIVMNPKSAILYANRASVFLKMKKPNAAIRDAEAALQINMDSAKGYKARGMARAMLGLWQEAATDLRVASKLDFDEEIGSIMKKVEPNAHKIDEHHRKYERIRKETKLRKIELQRQRRKAKSQDAEAASALKDGEVMVIPSARELETKLNAALKASRLAVIYYTAAWCGPCRYTAPVFSSLALKHPKAVFLKVDIDEARDAAAEYNISSVPTFFFMKNGKEVDRIVGADKNSLERKVAQHAG